MRLCFLASQRSRLEEVCLLDCQRLRLSWSLGTSTSVSQRRVSVLSCPSLNFLVMAFVEDSSRPIWRCILRRHLLVEAPCLFFDQRVWQARLGHYWLHFVASSVSVRLIFYDVGLFVSHDFLSLRSIFGNMTVVCCKWSCMACSHCPFHVAFFPRPSDMRRCRDRRKTSMACQRYSKKKTCLPPHVVPCDRAA